MARRPYRVLRLVLILGVLLFWLASCSNGSSPSPTPASGLIDSTAQPLSETPTIESAHASGSGQSTTMPSASADLCVLADDERMTVEQYEEALACAITYFDWSENYRLDLGKVHATLAKNTPGDLYGDGFEFIFLSLWNACAWDSAWLAARQSGDQASEQEALHMMAEVIPNFPSVIPKFPVDALDQGVLAMLRQNAEKASLGDPSGVQEYIQYQCTFDVNYWAEPS